MNILQIGVVDDLLNYRRLFPDWPNNSPHPDVRPDEGRIWMTLQKRPHLRGVGWFGARFGERNIDVVMDQNYQAHLGGKID